MASGNGSRPSTPTVAIIGAGFGGIGLGIQLLRAGIATFTILEKADGVGGVWRDNSYPGLTCDVPSHLYSFSFEPKHDWSRRYPRREEILEYLEHCTDKYGVREHLRLGTEVAACVFDEQAARWRIRTTSGDELETDFLVTATGQLLLLLAVRKSACDICRYGVRFETTWATAARQVSRITWCASCFNAECEPVEWEESLRPAWSAAFHRAAAEPPARCWAGARAAVEDLERRGLV